MNNIRYIKHKDIDKAAWDKAIAKAPNGLVYAYSFYLDEMSPGWNALITDGYNYVFPLTWRKKYGIRYLYQPFLVAQSGLFGKDISVNDLKNFLDAIPAHYRYLDINLNQSNVFPQEYEGIFLRANYTLDLKPSYDIIAGQYRQNIKRNIKKAMQAGCRAVNNAGIDNIISLAIENGNDAHELAAFKKVYTALELTGDAACYGVLDAKGKLVASAAFLFSHKRAYYLLVANHPNGRTIGASHMLIDHFISEHAGQDLLLDFEGSDIHNVAFFYSSFGAKEEQYAALKLNRLPALLKWMKP